MLMTSTHPYLARQGCRGGTLRGLEHLWGRGPLLVRQGGRRPRAEQIEVGRARGDGRFLPSFGALRRDKTPTAACLVILCSCSRERESVVFSGLRMSRTSRTSRTEPPLRCAWASFYTLKGSPTGGNAEKGTNVKSEVVGTVTCTVHPT